MATKKRKERGPHEREGQDDAKEVKACLTQGRALLEKATCDQGAQAALNLLNRLIGKIGIMSQMPYGNQIHHLRGQCYFRLRQFELAEKDFLEAISICIDDKSKIPFENSLGRCKMQLAQKNPSIMEDAIKCFERALQYSNRTDGEAFLNLGLVYKLKGKVSFAIQAIKHFTEALKYLKPHEIFQAHMERGICSREIQEMQNSTEDFTKACELKKDDPFCHFNLGLNHLLCNHYDAALSRFELAIQLNKTEPQFHNYKALTIYEMGDEQNSIEIFSEALKLYQQKGSNPEVAECWLNKGNAFLFLGQHEQALECYALAETSQPDDKLKIKIKYGEGQAYEQQKSIQAINKFQQCLSLIGDAVSHDLFLSCLYHLGCNQHSHRQYRQTIESLSKIIESGCQDRCVLELRGRAYFSNEEYEQALRDFQAIAVFDSNYPEVHFYLGKTKTKLGDIQAAIRCFFRAKQLGSRNGGFYNGLSEAYLLDGHPEKALIYSNISLEKYPRSEQFLLQRSQIFLSLNEYRKSIDDLTNALELNAQNPMVFYRRGLAYYKNKQYQFCIRDLQKSLSCNPSRSVLANIYYHIGIAHANLQKFEESIEPLNQAIAYDPQPRYLHERAKSSILLDKNEEALSDLNQVIKQQSENAFAYFRRGFAQKALRNYEQAANDFLKARQLQPTDPRLIINKKQIYQTKYRKLCEPGEEE